MQPTDTMANKRSKAKNRRKRERRREAAAERLIQIQTRNLINGIEAMLYADAMQKWGND